MRSRSAMAPSGSSFAAHATTRCCASTRPPARSRGGRGFPGSSPIDGLAAGLGSVWVVASSNAMLYRIDPRSAAVTGRIDLGDRAARGPRWCCGRDLGRPGRSSGGDTLSSTLGRSTIRELDRCCSPATGATTRRGMAAIWPYDMPTGSVVRWDGPGPISTIHVTRSHRMAVLRRAVPDLDRGRCRCRVGDGRRERRTTAAEPPGYGGQPASAHPQPLLSRRRPRLPRIVSYDARRRAMSRKLTAVAALAATAVTLAAVAAAGPVAAKQRVAIQEKRERRRSS